MRSFVTGLLIWVALLSAWFFFIFQFSASELVVGAMASAVALFALHRSLCAVPVGARIHFSWLATICYVPAATVDGLRILLRSLGRLLQGHPSQSVWQTVPFHPLDNEHDYKHGRIALASLFTTLTPNSYVVDFDDEADRLIVHSLENEPVSPMIRRLEGISEPLS